MVQKPTLEVRNYSEASTSPGQTLGIPCCFPNSDIKYKRSLITCGISCSIPSSLSLRAKVLLGNMLGLGLVYGVCSVKVFSE